MIRRAVPEDAMAVARVHVRSWQAAYRGLLPDEYLDALRPEDRAQRYTFHRTGATDPATAVAVAEDGAVRGFATTGPCRDAGDWAAGEILALYVDPEYWRHGIGRNLMASARQRLVDGGFADAVLWVLDGNDRAQRFYRRDGWQPDGGSRTDVVWAVSVRELRYRTTLTKLPT